MNYTTVDTLSITFPISYFKKYFSQDRCFAAKAVFAGSANASYLRDIFGPDKTFEDLAEVCNAEVYQELMNSFLFDAFGYDFKIDTCMKGGMNYFRHQYTFEGGFVTWGGNNRCFDKLGETMLREERIQIMLNGHFCSNYLTEKMRHHIRGKVIENQGTITRLDIALDLFKGESSYLSSVQAYQEEQFKLEKASKSPFSNVIFELSETGAGNTHYVGRRKSGKLYRGYEKGKQLGDKASEWFRMEVEYNTNNHRVINPDCLIYPDVAFAEAYPYCSQILALVSAKSLNSGEKLVKIVKDAKQQIQVTALIRHARNSYGKFIAALGTICDSQTGEAFTPTQIYNLLHRDGIPARLDRASLESFALRI